MIAYVIGYCYRYGTFYLAYLCNAGNSDIQWCFSQVKGTLDDDVTEGKYLPAVRYNLHIEKLQASKLILE